MGQNFVSRSNKWEQEWDSNLAFQIYQCFCYTTLYCIKRFSILSMVPIISLILVLSLGILYEQLDNTQKASLMMFSIFLYIKL